MSQSNKISTLWLNGNLRKIDNICLKSMVANNMDVTLYSYGKINNVPDGVKIADGNEILDIALLERLKLVKNTQRNNRQPVANFSDFFRIFLLKYEKGLWLDTDVFLFRPFQYDTTKVFFAYEDWVRIGSPVFYLPKENPIINEFEKLITQNELMPNWLGLRRGILKPMWWKLTNQPFSPPDLGITIYGNDAFTRLAKRHGFYDLALPKHTFYHWTGKETDKLFKPVNYQFLIDEAKHIGIHIHRKHWEHEPVQKNSFWEWALEKYGG